LILFSFPAYLPRTMKKQSISRAGSRDGFVDLDGVSR